MAAQTNGRPKKPKTPGQNGHLNGHINGHPNGHINGNANASKSAGPIVRARSAGKPKKTIMGSLVSVVTRYLQSSPFTLLCCPQAHAPTSTYANMLPNNTSKAFLTSCLGSCRGISSPQYSSDARLPFLNSTRRPLASANPISMHVHMLHLMSTPTIRPM